MAVVSRPLNDSRRAGLLRRVRQAAPSLWMTALAYMLLLVLGYLLLTPVLGWGQRRLDDLRYGFPRSTQVDGFVGHGEQDGEPTHLVGLNIHGQISILELPGGDASTLRTIQGPYLVGADGPYAVPMLTLQDVTDDGNVDLLVQIRDEVVVYVNENGTFRLMTPTERAQFAAKVHGSQ
jgi:hypothetical protein